MTDDPTKARRLARLGLASLAAAAVIGGGAAVALAGGDPDPAPASASAASESAEGTATAHDHDGAGMTDADTPGDQEGQEGEHRGGRGHRHPALPAYAERYGDATPDERRAADDLVDETRQAIAAFADPAAAEAAGYGPPRRAGGRLHHHLNRALVADGDVLDPAHPEGLVYADGPDGPQLVGAFFVAPPGVSVPGGAGDLVTWHSHDPDCPGFWATAAEPCTGTRRMLHVWTADSVDLVRRNGETVTVEVVDPFGAPFHASVERAG
jgi:hypothetical protein